MTIQPVPTFRAAHLVPYLDLLYSKRALGEDGLDKFKLPTTLETQRDAQIPLLPALQFLTYIGQKEGLHDPGLIANDKIGLKLLSRSNRHAILSAPTLKAAIETFQQCVAIESNVIEGWTTLDGSTARICKNSRACLDVEEQRPLKIHFMLLTLSIIRAFAGADWQPEVVALRCRVPLSPLMGRCFPRTKFLLGQSCSWISLPTHMLKLRRDYPASSTLNTPVLPRMQTLEETRNFVQKDDFVSTLKSVLKVYLHEGYPTIELAAEISGRSVRTLQRNLASSRMTYSKLVEDARFEAAVELLGKTGSKIIDIAYAVGYQDPSHFSRAFRRIAGTSPRVFRLAATA